MRSRSLGVIFIAAVIVPSILLAILSIRSAGREEAWMERQMAATLDAEVSHTASLAAAEVGRVIDDLRGSLDVPAGYDYARILARWKSATPLVSVPFMLSPRYGILWPLSDARANGEQERFLKDNGSFLSDRTTTTVLQNIAVRYQDEILAESTLARAKAGASQAQSAPPAEGELDKSAPAPQRRAAAEEQAGAAAAPTTQPASAAQSTSSAPLARQKAIDTFAQSADIQTRVYEEAREKGDTLNARIVEPKAMVQEGPSGYGASGATTADAVTTEAAAAPANAVVVDVPSGGKDRSSTGAAEQLKEKSLSGGSAPRDEALRDDAAKQAPSPKKSAVTAKEPPSQFVVTSQLLSQIAAQGDAGLIPRFIGEKLVFLFWERQRDGRIAGCEVSSEALRSRVAGVLTSTWSPVRILTLLDENGSPLAAPPESGGRDWRRPFVAREIGESLPRWEAAAYLTRPDSIAAQARSSSLVIWIMVMILFVSVAGGGTMVLSSVYGEMRLAQQKATFVTNVSHELKTPLTSIGLFIDLLRRKGPLAPTKKEQYLSLMASETERLTRLINNVLDFSRDKAARRYTMRTINAVETANEIVQSQRVRLESRGFSLSSDIETAEALVRADPEALKQVILNLLSNAEKYSAEKKEIVVTVSAESKWVLISVCDRGIGIPESEREKVFREFYRVDDSLSSGVQGTGLGLTIARRIARDHGGDLTCAPRNGGGTEFIVRLPAVDEAADGPEAEGPAAEKGEAPA